MLCISFICTCHPDNKPSNGQVVVERAVVAEEVVDDHVDAVVEVAAVEVAHGERHTDDTHKGTEEEGERVDPIRKIEDRRAAVPEGHPVSTWERADDRTGDSPCPEPEGEGVGPCVDRDREVSGGRTGGAGVYRAVAQQIRKRLAVVRNPQGTEVEMQVLARAVERVAGVLAAAAVDVVLMGVAEPVAVGVLVAVVVVPAVAAEVASGQQAEVLMVVAATAAEAAAEPVDASVAAGVVPVGAAEAAVAVVEVSEPVAAVVPVEVAAGPAAEALVPVAAVEPAAVLQLVAGPAPDQPAVVAVALAGPPLALALSFSLVALAESVPNPAGAQAG